MAKKQSVFAFIDGDKKTRREQARAVRTLGLEAQRQLAEEQPKKDLNAGFPKRRWSSGGQPRRHSGRGATMLTDGGVKVAGHTAATAYPFCAGPNLGASGPPIGEDLYGGGLFCADPWDLYRRGIISGMAMLLFGTVGTGKSSLAKSWTTRLVQFGKKLAVPSDLKGEWTEVIHRLKGKVIQIGPGLPTRLNPLEEGVRPSIDRMGNPLSDEGWKMMVRTRRLSILTTIVKILTGQDEVTPAENNALQEGVEGAVAIAENAGRMMIIPDVIEALRATQSKSPGKIANACEDLVMSLERLHTGDVGGMFDGLSTVTFDSDVPAVSIDTAALRGATQTGRRVASACCGTWIEAMVTNPDGGQRLVVYEEGWDAVTSRADLERMVENWKLARDYGIFNILILHKVSDLNMAGDQGSQMAAMAKSLLADADIKVIYRQDAAALRSTTEELELNDKERQMLKTLPKGTGMWRMGQKTFHVSNDLTVEEEPLFDTDQRLRASGDTGEEDAFVTVGDHHFTDWAAPSAGREVA